MDRRSFCFFLGSVGLVGCSAGCARPAPLAIEVGVGFDTTPKDIEKRARYASQLVNYVKPGDAFTLRASDHKVSIISTARPKNDAEAYQLLMDVSKKLVPVTDLATYFETVATTAESGEGPLVTILYSDGLDDGKNPDQVAARITAAAERLSKAPRLRAFVIAGTVRDVRSGWTGLPEMLGPIKSKLTILPMAGFNPDSVQRRVKDVRASISAEDTKGTSDA